MVVAIGGSSVLAALITGLVTGLFGRGKNRADAAKQLTEIATGMTKTINEQFTDLGTKVDHLADAVVELTDSVDTAVPLLRDQHPDVAQSLRDRNRETRQALRRIL
ncbi:hypothetical protein Y710_16330 [Gordonia sp. QH-12]|uniref:hypothetical protein n=1 Tax=Gordonia sp. QH-12 TaxID=1437876 RepID=UPI0007815E73|nr:hypothetical protein [Gordonia sp. QH-12]KXT55917.1 hypothetical protein Y710_16330 [Gordonia sp. QH-12]